jgi:hypothetical protein
MLSRNLFAMGEGWRVAAAAARHICGPIIEKWTARALNHVFCSTDVDERRRRRRSFVYLDLRLSAGVFKNPART